MAYALMPSMPLPPPDAKQMYITAMPISLPSLPTGLVLSATSFLLMRMTLKRHTLNWLSKRKQIPRTKINQSVTLLPCSIARKGRTSYTYENMELRMFPGIQRDTEERNSLYKIRTIVKRAINHFKINMCVAGRHSRNHLTTKADVFLAGIASQLTVIVAHRMHQPEYIRNLKPLIA